MPDPVPFEVLGDIGDKKIIASGRGIRELRGLQKIYGPGRWRKMKGVGRVWLPDGTIADAEVHCYEAHGVGRCELKIKRLLPIKP